VVNKPDDPGSSLTSRKNFAGQATNLGKAFSEYFTIQAMRQLFFRRILNEEPTPHTTVKFLRQRPQIPVRITQKRASIDSVQTIQVHILRHAHRDLPGGETWGICT